MASFMRYQRPTGFFGINGLLPSVCEKLWEDHQAANKSLKKKNVLCWNKDAQKAFESLKLVMITVPVLIMLDFTKKFVVKTDASKTRIGFS